MRIDEENADDMVEDEDAMGKEDTSDIELIDAVAIVKHPEESNSEIVMDNLSDDEMKNSYKPAEDN